MQINQLTRVSWLKTQMVSLLQQIPPSLYGLILTVSPVLNAPWLGVFTGGHMVVVMRTQHGTC